MYEYFEDAANIGFKPVDTGVDKRSMPVYSEAPLWGHRNKETTKIAGGSSRLKIDLRGCDYGVMKLTPREFRLFALLVENAGRILTHKQVLEKVWG